MERNITEEVNSQKNTIEVKVDPARHVEDIT